MSKSSARVVLKAASVDTRNNDRDNHLRSADFFDVEKWPDITFESTQIEEVSDNAYVISGHLTIRDVTKPVTIPSSSWASRPTRSARSAPASRARGGSTDRRDGLEWNMPLDKGGVLVSERISLEFEISAIQKVAEGSGEQPQGHEGEHHEGEGHHRSARTSVDGPPEDLGTSRRSSVRSPSHPGDR